MTSRRCSGFWRPPWPTGEIATQPTPVTLPGGCSHSDPRYLDHLTFWLQGDRGVLVIDSRNPEINAFTVPGQPVTPLIEWAQRRLDGRGQVGWVSDDDIELVSYLESNGYAPGDADPSYCWDLAEVEVPESRLPDDWA